MASRLLILIIVTCCMCVNSCGVPELLIDIHEMRQNYLENQQVLSSDFDRFCQGYTGTFPFDITVGTDSSVICFHAHYWAIADVKGIRYLHGSAGNDLEYHAIPFSNIRHLALAWPLKIMRIDSTPVTAEGGKWKLIYENGILFAVDTGVIIPASDIARIESGYDQE
jgi:hypothetical protein